MPDPRLNSAHLEWPRRQVFERTRSALLRARGPVTLGQELADDILSVDELLSSVSWPPNAKAMLLAYRTGPSFPLHVGLNTIGRFTDNDLMLDRYGVSRRHCTILIHAGGGSELYDTASTNGTFVNAKRVTQPVSLVSGDFIQICHELFYFVTADRYQGAIDTTGGEATH